MWATHTPYDLGNAVIRSAHKPSSLSIHSPALIDLPSSVSTSTNRPDSCDGGPSNIMFIGWSMIHPFPRQMPPGGPGSRRKGYAKILCYLKFLSGYKSWGGARIGRVSRNFIGWLPTLAPCRSEATPIGILGAGRLTAHKLVNLYMRHPVPRIASIMSVTPWVALLTPLAYPLSATCLIMP